MVPPPKIQPDDGDPRHGTLNAYNNLYCRCDECREAVREGARLRQRAWREAHRVERELRVRTHGTISNYHEGCRCDDCTDAMRVWMNEYRARMRQLTFYGPKKLRVYLRKWEQERF